jgi:hypothetical protein
MSGTELKINEIDERLTGNPQITFFKSVYRRHTYFLKIIKEYPIDNKKTEIRKDVDLISDIYIKTTLTSIPATTTIYSNLGNNIVKEIKLMADGNRTLYETQGLWMETLSELENSYIPVNNGDYSTPPIITTTSGNKLAVDTGNLYNISCFAGGVSGSITYSSASSTETFFTRPNFDFCRSYEKSFPLCALNNTEISLSIEFRKNNEYTSENTHTRESKLLVEGIILSLDEKRRISNNTKPYIFFNYGGAQIDNSITINSVGPVRSIYIVGKPADTQTTALSHSTPAELSSTLKINYKLNNILETTKLDLKVYTLENIYRYYGDNGFGGRELSSGNPSAQTKNLGHYNSIGIITQSLEPINEPNGHFSASDKITIDLSENANNTEVFYEYINYYRIMGGQINTIYQ